VFSCLEDLYGSASPATPGENLDVTSPDAADDKTDAGTLDDDVVLDHDQTVEKFGPAFLQRFMIFGIVIVVVFFVLRGRHSARGRFTKSAV